MNLILRNRNPGLVERMDDPLCDRKMLFRTYDRFHIINRLISGWRRIYLQYVRPELSGGATSILDVGCGGGDITRRLAEWAARDSFPVQITGIDPDERALEYISTRVFPRSITFRAVTTSDLVREGASFDLVLSNHLLHHLGDSDLMALLDDSSALARRLVIHNDIRRDDLAYAGFLSTLPFFPGSFITVDGLTSIRRSFTPSELEPLLPAGWAVRRMALFRNLIYWRPLD